MLRYRSQTSLPSTISTNLHVMRSAPAVPHSRAMQTGNAKRLHPVVCLFIVRVCDAAATVFNRLAESAQGWEQMLA